MLLGVLLLSSVSSCVYLFVCGLAFYLSLSVSICLYLSLGLSHCLWVSEVSLFSHSTVSLLVPLPSPLHLAASPLLPPAAFCLWRLFLLASHAEQMSLPFSPLGSRLLRGLAGLLVAAASRRIEPQEAYAAGVSCTVSCLSDPQAGCCLRCRSPSSRRTSSSNSSGSSTGGGPPPPVTGSSRSGGAPPSGGQQQPCARGLLAGSELSRPGLGRRGGATSSYLSLLGIGNGGTPNIEVTFRASDCLCLSLLCFIQCLPPLWFFSIFLFSLGKGLPRALQIHLSLVVSLFLLSLTIHRRADAYRRQQTFSCNVTSSSLFGMRWIA